MGENLILPIFYPYISFLNQMNRTYKLHLQKAPEGGFIVTLPILPGCITEGDTLDEAISRAKEG